MKKQNFTEFKKCNTNAKIKEIAELYAKSETEFARTYFTEHYNITQSCFYKIIETAIVQNIISDKYCNLIAAKASINQRKHGAGQVSSSLHHEQLMRTRIINKINNYPNDYIISIANEYANNSLVTAQDLSNKYDMSLLQYNFILDRAITTCLVTNEAYEKIKSHSLNSSKNLKNAQKYFYQVEIKRSLILLPKVINDLEETIKVYESSQDKDDKTFAKISKLQSELASTKETLNTKIFESNQMQEAKQQKLKMQKELKQTRKQINGKK